VEPLCGLLGDRREPVRRIAAASLALRAAPDATACLRDALAQGEPAARVSAASVLRWLLANRQVPAPEGYELVKQLAQDPDPAIRISAIGAFLMFNADFAVPAVTPLSSDPDPAVALAARNKLGEIEVIRKVDLLRAGR
jgi:HEAT repeat protein